MPINNPARYIGSSRTTAQVYVYRHNRTPYSVHGEVDISAHVTQLTMSNSLAGGGVLTLFVAPTVPWEDEFAPNDIVNVYLNTNRNDDKNEYARNDVTWRYNIGNVRVFFGYISTISRSVSVSNDGSRSTSYSIVCNTFDKAIRATSIYNNPHLSYQGNPEDQEDDVVRADMRANVGGIALYQKGYLIAGTPRKLILSHLMRTLGFGGQWLLPLGYRDSVYGSEYYVDFSVRKSNETEKRLSTLDFTYTAEIKKRKSSELGPQGSSSNPPSIVSNTTFEVPRDSINRKLLSTPNEVIKDLEEALVNVATQARLNHWTTKEYL